MKTLLKNLLIPPLASHPVSSLASRIFGYGIPVFLIHRVSHTPRNQGCIAVSHLQRCLQYLVDHGYTFIALDQLVTTLRNNGALPEKPVVFTMDDGFADQAEIAAPVFSQYGCPLTFFVISGLLDQKLWPWDTQASWIINNTTTNHLTIDFPDERLEVAIDEQSHRHHAREQVRNYFKEVDARLLPELMQQLAETAAITPPSTPPPEHRAMSWQQARDLEKQGVQFAPHSDSHCILSKLDNTSVTEEILHSWQRLQDELKQPVKIFCYPTGRIFDFGPREKNILQDNGFSAAVSTMPGYIEKHGIPQEQLYSLPRLELPADMSDFIQYCSWIEHAKKQ